MVRGYSCTGWQGWSSAGSRKRSDRAGRSHGGGRREHGTSPATALRPRMHWELTLLDAPSTKGGLARPSKDCLHKRRPALGPAYAASLASRAYNALAPEWPTAFLAVRVRSERASFASLPTGVMCVPKLVPALLVSNTELKRSISSWHYTYNKRLFVRHQETFQ